MTTSLKPKALVLKLGSECNLKCTHCHAAHASFELDEAIFPFIEAGGYTRITFSGGEPLMYFETIKRVILRLGPGYEYRFVTNATLLTEEIVDFLNEHGVWVAVSYDGEKGGRDESLPIRYDLVGKIRYNGLSTCLYAGNSDMLSISRDIAALRDKHGLNDVGGYPYDHAPEFVHQTALSSSIETTKETARDYMRGLSQIIERQAVRFNHGAKLKELGALMKALNKWWTVKEGEGVKCCGDHLHNLTLDGRLLLCPYTLKTVGDIATGLDLEKVREAIPGRCKLCPIWSRCRNTCIENITTNECYIARQMCAWLDRLVERYGMLERLAQDPALVGKAMPLDRNSDANYLSNGNKSPLT